MGITTEYGDEFGIHPALIESSIPSFYRLSVNKSGEITLQGAYKWERGIESGINWENIPTVHLED